MVERIPITEPDDVFTLDEAEMIDGYNDGRANEACGDNRSTAYWHGWRNGMVDGGHAKGDDAQRILAGKLVKDGRLRLRFEADEQGWRGRDD